MINRPTAVLTEAQVISILELLEASIPQWKIAEQFGVSKKSINRISTGETWSDVSQRYHLKKHPPKMQPVCNIIPIPDMVADMLDEVTAVKNHFGFSFKQPIYWGWFNSWDGIHSIASDGYIAWESTDLVAYAQKLANSGVNDAPIYADLAEEMPTFELEDMMIHPIGDKFTVEMDSGSVVRLIDSVGRAVFLHQRYVHLATKMRLEIRRAEDVDDAFVYLTKLKPNSRNNDLDPAYIPIACISTMID